MRNSASKLKRTRFKNGSVIAEAPIVVWAILFVLFFPLLDLGAICLRSAFLYLAVHNATRDASRARSFEAPVGGKQSAKQIAATRAAGVTQMFSGVRLTAVTTQIVITDIASNTMQKQSTPLTAPADDSNKTYQIEVTVDGTAAPLITFSSPGLGAIPGLTEAMPIRFTDRQFVENPQGLNI